VRQAELDTVGIFRLESLGKNGASKIVLHEHVHFKTFQDGLESSRFAVLCSPVSRRISCGVLCILCPKLDQNLDAGIVTIRSRLVQAGGTAHVGEVHISTSL